MASVELLQSIRRKSAAIERIRGKPIVHITVSYYERQSATPFVSTYKCDASRIELDLVSEMLSASNGQWRSRMQMFLLEVLLNEISEENLELTEQDFVVYVFNICQMP